LSGDCQQPSESLDSSGTSRPPSCGIGGRWLTWLLAAAVVVGIGVALRGFAVDSLNVRLYGTVDLRPRVVGARLLHQGLDPYTFRWSPRYPETLHDLMADPEFPYSRVSMTPPVVLLHEVTASLPYATQRVLWFYAQWLCLLGSLWLLTAAAPTLNRKLAIWAAGLLFLPASFAWHLHVERGQMYILYVFFVSLAYWLWVRGGERGPLLGGFVLGLSAVFRPHMLLMVVPMAIYRQWRGLTGTLLGFALCLLVSLPLTGVSVWHSYSASMKSAAAVHEGLKPDAKAPPPGLSPEPVEGLDNMTNYLLAPGLIDSSLQSALHELGVMGRKATLHELTAGLGLVVLLLAVAWYFYRSQPSAALTFLAGTMLIVLGDYFTPSIRGPYNNVLWLLPVCFLILYSERRRLLCSPLNLLLLVLLIWLPLLLGVPHNRLLSSLLVPLCLTAMMFWALRHDGSAGQASRS
jgi:hypothetical protein